MLEKKTKRKTSADEVPLNLEKCSSLPTLIGAMKAVEAAKSTV